MARNKLIDLSKTIVADKRFTMDDKEYQYGEEVDLTGKTDRQIDRLFRHRFVRMGEPTAQDAPTGDVTDAPTGDVTDAPTGDVTDAPTGDVTDSAPEQDDTPVAEAPVGDAPVANSVTLKHVGGGYYEALDSNDVNVLNDKVQGKDNAKLVAEQLGFVVA